MPISSASIFTLPTAALVPVKQGRRRGSLPAGVVSFCDALKERGDVKKEIDFLLKVAQAADETALQMRLQANALRGKSFTRGGGV